jgi:membrane fusion protein, multidrug efflux system
MSIPKKLFIIVGVVLVVIVIVGGVPKFFRHQELARAVAAEKDEPMLVRVESPKRAAATSQVVLPATADPIQRASIYARTNGYIQKWTVDIGTTVRAGAVLATLETPEIDQQLAQARAALTLAKANSERIKSVTLSGAVSQQDRDKTQSDFDAATASVKQLEALASFKKVIAPFSGVITRRSIDVGSLVSSGGSGTELFRLEQNDSLRFFVNVPQSYAASIKTGLEAEILIQEMPDKKLTGFVARTAGALDAATRTLLTEVHLANLKHEILSGIYAQVKFNLTSLSPPLVVSSKVLKIDSKGTFVAIVDNGKINLKLVQLGRDFGNEVEILSGLTGTEKLALYPNDKMQSGVEVKIFEASVPSETSTRSEKK